MRVSDQHRFVFIHVQKTGGSTIDAMLDAEIPDVRGDPAGKRHIQLQGALRQEPALASYWIFGFVRNPWSRLVSWWAMIMQCHERAAAGDETAIRNLQRDNWWMKAGEYTEFADFVTYGSEEFPRLKRPQVNYLTAGPRRADFVGRTETFDADVAAIRARLGLPPLAAVPQFNTSAHKDWREYYTPQTRDLVAKMYAADIAAFGYEFDAATVATH